MQTPLKLAASTTDFNQPNEPEDLFLDSLFQDLHQYNKIAYEASDSEDEEYESANKGNITDEFPTINIIQDIGPLSRSLFKLTDEKSLRKKLSQSYMHNYWNKIETKELNEDLVVGCVANKIPVTPLLYSLQINQYKTSIIKSEIDYSQTSGSDEEDVSPPHYTYQSQDKSIFNTNSIHEQVESQQFDNRIICQNQNSTKLHQVPLNSQVLERIPQEYNCVIEEEVEHSGEDIQLTQGSVPVGNDFTNYRNHNNKEDYRTEHRNPVLNNSPPPNLNNLRSGENQIMQFEILEEGGEIPVNLGGLGKQNKRRESKSSQLIRLLSGDIKRKRSEDSRKTSTNYLNLVPRPPSTERINGRPQINKNIKPSLNPDLKESIKEKAHSESEKSRSILKDKELFLKSGNTSKINKSSMNSSLNQSEYNKNFVDLVDKVEGIIHERRKLKIGTLP